MKLTVHVIQAGPRKYLEIEADNESVQFGAACDEVEIVDRTGEWVDPEKGGK